MSPANIRAAEFAIEKVLSDDYVFTIPRYQRPYSWTIYHTEALLDDLLLSLGNNGEPISEINPYFLGSIVLIKGDGANSEVVDGQQRLTTLTILLAVLRDYGPAYMSNDFTNFLYEKGNALKGTNDRFRLTLRERDSSFFKVFIQKEGGIKDLKEYGAGLSSSQKNIKNNALYFLRRIMELPEDMRARLAMFIISRCFLVVVCTPDFDSAYRIFSVLNDRGMDLTHSDILKAEIIGQIPVSMQEVYTKKWEDAEDKLGRDEFKNLFAHIRMIYRKKKLEKTILEEVRRYVNPYIDPQKFLDQVLLPMADSMYDVLMENYESSTKAEEINNYFLLLQRVDNFDWVPPLVLYMSKYRDNSEKLLRFLIDLERLAMGLMIKRANINERIERYARLLTEIEGGNDLFDNKSPLQLSKEECTNILNTLDGKLYLITKLRLPVLLRLDEEISGGGASYTYKTISVEHVLPQNPSNTSQWIKWFPDQDLREDTVHRIGNLVLLSRIKNAQASNFEFDRKKKEYFLRKGVSPFAITTQVINEVEWTTEVINRRQGALLDVFRKIWRL